VSDAERAVAAATAAHHHRSGRAPRAAATAVALAGLLLATTQASGMAQPDGATGAAAEVVTGAATDVVVQDGRTQPVFSYADAVREVVQVESPVSSHDGDEPDLITVDIIRPAESDGDLDVPTIMIPSPYYSGPGRGRTGETKPDPQATPSVVAGGQHHGGALLSGSTPLTGQAGHLVDCGAAVEVSDCPDDTAGAIALIERDPALADASNLATQATVTCSYTSPWESCPGIASGSEPASSTSSPRWGTWPETGDHWVELAFDEPRTVSVADLYWFQDSADGSGSGVKRPADWSLSHHDGDGWVEVDLAPDSGYGDDLDAWNRVAFAPVETSRLRLDVTTRGDAMGVGAVEWRVFAVDPAEAVDQVAVAEAAGARGAVVYHHAETGVPGGSVGDDVTIPGLAVDRDAGLALLEAAGADADLRQLVQPIDRFPLYYDNLFVPRGYAVALVDMAGSRASTGCLDVGGPAEIDGTAAVVEWLAGSGTAVDGSTGQPVDAHWSSGRTAMIGKSWDGTVPYGVAARGTPGLTTIVPLVGLSHWHSDFWESGARYGGSPTQWHDGNSNNPAMSGRCTATRAELAAGQVQPDPDHPFWVERDYVRDVDRFGASVFIVHGMNDDNVKPVNFGRMWDQLVEHDVTRRMWLSQVAHDKPFDFRRDAWLDEIHRWFDHQLHDVDNGILDTPAVEVEHAPNEWSSYAGWPNGADTTRLWFGAAGPDDAARTATLWPDARDLGADGATFAEVRRNRTQLAQAPHQDDHRRLAFLSPELEAPLHLSGETEVTVRATVDGEEVTFTALLVDHGTAERVQYGVQGGVVTLDGEDCIGQGTQADTGCYPSTAVRTTTNAFQVVSRGWAQASFVLGEAPTPGEPFELTFGLQHHDYVFEAGHRVGLILSGPETHLHNARHPTTNLEVEVEFGPSSVQLPVVGGHRALAEAFGHDPVAPLLQLIDQQGLPAAVGQPLVSLAAQVDRAFARDDLGQACRAVERFVGHVDLRERQPRHGLDAAQAEALRTDAGHLADSLACG
jgi:X-Pro dipeptidyl-peptidase